ncbi:MAG: helix-turn-helix transcriptional regulator [Chloroflexi bacterium]|nr:helix-turn-helix transcriptional regulator [Chloroflexota bacterium]
MSLGKVIRQKRLQSGLTLTQLGARCGVSPARLRRIESDQCYPSARSLVRIGEHLGLSAPCLESVILKLLLEELAALSEALAGNSVTTAS